MGQRAWAGSRLTHSEEPVNPGVLVAGKNQNKNTNTNTKIKEQKHKRTKEQKLSLIHI